MTKEYLENILTEYGVAFTDSLADRLLKEFEPSNDMVSRGVFEQIMWERDVATEQLKELGYELGSKVEPCDNAISRKLVKTEYKRRLESSLKDESRGLDLTHLADCTRFNEFIDSIPPVNTTKTGHWIKTGYIDKVTCSNCNRKMWNFWEVNDFDHCPDCGARMVEPQERSDKE